MGIWDSIESAVRSFRSTPSCVASPTTRSQKYDFFLRDLEMMMIFITDGQRERVSRSASISQISPQDDSQNPWSKMFAADEWQRQRLQ